MKKTRKKDQQIRPASATPPVRVIVHNFYPILVSQPSRVTGPPNSLIVVHKSDLWAGKNYLSAFSGNISLDFQRVIVKFIADSTRSP